MKIIIFDDDPTGSQTVCNCPLLLKWDKDTISNALKDSSPLLFLLVNTRSMLPALAEKTIRKISKLVSEVLINEGFPMSEIIFVSRGDSTLRGHGVLEPQVINDVLGPFDATFHVPAFFEGNRITINGIHLLNGLPVHLTEFARDSNFQYSNSKLDLWLEEKSEGTIMAKNVKELNYSILNNALDSKQGFQYLQDWLAELSGNQPVVVDAQIPNQLDVLSLAIRDLLGEKRFLFRSAASMINSLSEINSKPFDPNQLDSFVLKNASGFNKPGLVMVGSHVPLADQQLKCLLQSDGVIGVELPVKKMLDLFSAQRNNFSQIDFMLEYINKLNDIIQRHKTPVLYTSRGEITLTSFHKRIHFGNFIAENMANITSKIAPQLGYLISKGGVTTHTLLEKGLNLSNVKLNGQLLPGLSLVTSNQALLSQNLPIVTFPGNLGDKYTLFKAWQLMEGKS